MSKPKISIIHPSRNRPELAKQTYDKWMGNAAKPDDIEYMLSVDVEDVNRSDYSVLFLGHPEVFAPWNMILVNGSFIFCLGHNHSAIDAINNAAKEAKGNILIVVSDDFDCPKNWDIDLLNALKGKHDYVVKTWDGAQPWIITLPIMDRAYYNRFGYIYPPHIKHMFADTWMTHVGDLLDKVVILNMHFPHRHYSQSGGIQKDAVSVKNDSTWAHGEAAYLEGIKTNFGLAETDIKGVLRCDRNHLEWLRKKGINCEVV